MTVRRYSPPSSSALVAFESAARLCNFSRAAEELNTSQSAVSRHIAGLEDRFGTLLFLRRKKGLRLTDHGSQFYQAVLASLETLQTVERVIGTTADKDQVTIACTHSTSHLFVMPRFEALQAATGPDIDVRIMTTEYEQHALLSDDDMDIRFVFGDGKGAASGMQKIFGEAVTPVCSPEFLERHRDQLLGPVTGWAGLPLLDISKRNLGWATWSGVAAAVGMTEPKPGDIRSFTNYVYLLEAAASGKGVALGWAGLVERYIETGALTVVPSFVHRTDRGLFAALTRRENKHDLCKKVLSVLIDKDAKPFLVPDMEEVRNPVEQML